MCGVEWECELNGAGDEGEDILGMKCESTEQSKWEHLAVVVDSGEPENVLPAGVCNHVKLSATRRSEAGIGFRGAGGERIRNHGQRKSKAGMWREAHGRWWPRWSQQGIVSISTARIPDRRVMSFLSGKLDMCSSSISGSEKTQPAGSREFA